jgi:GWxTD domain-containing protein
VPAACGPWQRVGTSAPPTTRPEQVAALLDPRAAYREMGLIIGSGQIPFLGSVHVLASGGADTALAVVALSLEDRQLTFQREANGFSAGYHVEVAFRRGATLVQLVSRDERVVVNTFRETQRAEESVIFQEFIRVPAGSYQLAITVRDRNGAKVGRYETPFEVPALQPPAIAVPICIYEATPRADLAGPPTLVVNPRSTVLYGVDTARFYVETYGLPGGGAVVATALDPSGALAWVDTTRVDSASAVKGFVVTVAPARLSVGRYTLRIAPAGGEVVATAPFLVAFSGQFAAANFEQILSLLRYFTSADTLRALAALPPDQRSAAWRKFLHDTDPNPATPENEALTRYFARLQIANEQFRDEGIPGWLTDRGEVYITIGAPDDVYDRRSEMQARGRVIIWTYSEYRLTLDFVDESGFGRYRLTPGSRSEYLQVVNRLRRAS